MPTNTLSTVIVPFLSHEEIKGLRSTRLGLRVYHDNVDARVDPRGQAYYWIIGDTPTGVSELGTDMGPLSDGFGSITPLQLDLTDYLLLPEINSWEWKKPVVND
ncbi:MAG: hypothetical protein CVU42_05310 [Chloroflexi bacterium HGW-Chloroflexi-4]|nr:MAG: hypothetical protein CVU42_05310 [Chloroflexi bacterium HGW-Chloroflexi-4]